MLLKPIQVTAPIWTTKHYVGATRFQFLGAQVATKALKSVCSTDFSYFWHFKVYIPPPRLFHIYLQVTSCINLFDYIQLSWPWPNFKG